jgi:hypothetical protein
VTVPARRPEDDALDRLDYASREMPHAPIGRFAADLLAVREALERQREEVDLTGTRPLTDIEVANQQALLLRAESAEAGVRRLTLERDTARRERNEAGDEAAVLRDTVRRLTEGLREARGHLRPEIGGRFDQHAAVDAIDRALLDSSPSDGGGA